MDREKAIRILTLFREEWDRHSKTPNAKALDMAIAALQEPEIVRCKDCKHWIDDYPYSDKVKKCELAGYMVGENGYCVYGKVEE